MPLNFSANGTDLENTFFLRTDTILDDPVVGGQLWAWGANGSGQLGLNDTANRSSPVQVGTDSNWVKVVSYDRTTAAIKSDGTLWIWGIGNQRHGNNDGASPTRSSPVQLGTALWKDITAGDGWFAAIKTNGTLWAWGSNSFGQLGEDNTTVYSSPVQVGAATNWLSVRGFLRTASGQRSDGYYYVWGDNTYGQLGVNSVVHRSSPTLLADSENSWKVVAPHNDHTLGISAEGKLYSWGRNSNGVLGLSEAGTVNRSSPVQIGTATNWRYAEPGYITSSAIKTDGTLWTWGTNSNGNLGLNNVASASSPVQVGTLSDWREAILSGTYTSIAVKTDGTLWTWGLGTNGGIGDNLGVSRSSPVQIGSPAGWMEVFVSFASSGESAFAVRTDY